MVEAARGTRDPDDGPREKIEDADLAATLRRQATGVWVRTLAVTVLGTLLLRFL